LLPPYNCVWLLAVYEVVENDDFLRRCLIIFFVLNLIGLLHAVCVSLGRGYNSTYMHDECDLLVMHLMICGEMNGVTCQFLATYSWHFITSFSLSSSIRFSLNLSILCVQLYNAMLNYSLILSWWYLWHY
jgi:hypothetical protein